MSYSRNQAIALAYRIFQEEEYTWLDSNEPPTYEEMDCHFAKLESDCIKDKQQCIETGRIKVEYDKEFKSFDYYLNLGHD